MEREMRIWQVEYMSRPDEREHIEQFDDFRVACNRAREMSDKHDGSSVVIAIDDMPNNQPGQMATGHIDFTFGIVGEKVWALANVAIPRVS